MAIIPVVYDTVTQTHRPAENGEFVVLSTQAGNYIRYGNDHGIYADGNDILSNGRENLLFIDTTDKKVTLTKAQLIAAGFMSGSVTDLVSTQAGNLLSVSTTDQKLYVGSSAMSGSGFVTLSEVQKLISADVDNAIKKGTDGLLYAPLDCGEI